MRYLIILLLFGLVFILSFCSVNQTDYSWVKKKFLNLSDSAKYVGMNTCASCHKDIYDNYMETGMGMSFGMATMSRSKGKFDEHALVYDKELDYYYKPYFKDSALYILEFRLNGKDTTHKRLEKIDFIIGSGHHTNSHLINRNGYLYQAPITFYTQEGRWDLAPGFEKGLNSRFSRIIATECLTCHNHYPKHFTDSENKYKDIPQGIECERCHGPGSIHVKEKLKGNIVDTSKFADYTITNPRHLPRDLQMDICQRCHLQGVAVLNDNKSFFDFKPGMKLSEIMQVYLPRFTNSHERFIMASQADRLRLSPCYLKSEDMSCITCHNPHYHVKSKEKNSYNKACLKCHSESKKNYCSVAPSERKSANDDCTSCHMKRTGSIDIPHITITDHNISKETARKKISEKDKNEIAKFLGLSCLTTNNPTDLDKAKGYLALYDKFMKEKNILDSVRYYLDKSKEPEDKKFSSSIHYYFAGEDYNSIVQSAKNQSIDKIEDAWTCYRVGEGYYRTNQLKEAKIFFEKAVKIRKHNLDFQEKLGVIYARLGDYEKAKDVFGFVLSEDAARPLTLTNLGLIAASSNAQDKAMYYYNKALTLDPDFETALINKSALLIFQKKNVEAKALLEHLIRKHPSNQQAVSVLKTLQ